MPNIKSAKKRVKVEARRTLENKTRKSAVRTIIKKFMALVSSGDKAGATALYPEVIQKLDQANKIYHKNAIARKKSQVTRALNKLA